MNIQLKNTMPVVASYARPADASHAGYAGYAGERLRSTTSVVSKATFRILTDAQIQEYRKTASPLAKEPWDEFHIDHSEWVK